MHMPDGEGTDLGRKIRQIDAEGATALILMTSLGEQGSLRRLEELASAAILPSPSADRNSAVPGLGRQGSCLAGR